MRFGIKLMPQHCTWDELLALWRAADEAEVFESAWTFDHFYPIYGDPDGPCLEGWTTLAALAQATTRIRIGCLVSGVVYRHPAVLANMAATVDLISGGRLELGLGAGWSERETTAYGIELGSLTERFDRFEEACEVITSLLRDPVTDFAGRYYTLTGARCEPKGPQRPHPPVCIGGGGEKRTLRIAAKYAQHWNFPGGAPADFVRKRDVLHAHCADLGRDPSEITTSTHLLMWPDKTVADVVAQAEAYAEAGLDLGIVYLQAPVAEDVVAELAAALEPLRSA
ncbi:LLM class F420-dependent oxidoreductase [Yinghuangia seranimata]|uniref:LLM class F420-dependent oxidoreductase n=1 Tax=Yinghuangia seranimata TaxID=408067 RepID=UPI00248AA01C|nr:LLM class F420-dependent oxidoreductase [Yinghuangia seranimata]MDI2131614.1 LLM class F420-dependent oxidoreductase [Yinghuangia seranimata]